MEQSNERPLEQIIQNFTTDYEIYSKDLRETGQVEEPDELFKDYQNKEGRALLLKAVAAYFALPQSIYERKRLLDKYNSLAGREFFSNNEARSAIDTYVTYAAMIRRQFGADWREALAKELFSKPDHPTVPDAIHRRFDATGTIGHLDKLMVVLQLPESGNVIEMLRRAKELNLFQGKDADMLNNTLADIEEFVINKDAGQKY